MPKVRDNANAHEIHMVAKPFILQLHPDKNRFEAWVQYLNQDHSVGFRMPYTVAEGNVILNRFWHKLLETKGHVIQKDQGIFINAEQKLCLRSLLLL